MTLVAVLLFHCCFTEPSILIMYRTNVHSKHMRLPNFFNLHLQFILLGAVPFPSDVPRLKQLGVQGVVTLNEPYETLVPTSLYEVKFSITC
uniref:Uncharacterized protein n=1 Tax=Arundo donax TaxID=35708 RepID=A0A0A9CR87_ARUDO